MELPSFDLDLQSDSVPAETGESLQGYAYPDPDSEGAAGGYDFNPMKVKHPAVAEYPEPDPEERQRIEEPPVCDDQKRRIIIFTEKIETFYADAVTRKAKRFVKL